MDDKLQQGDRTFISTTLASELTGYSQDYVGQLAREGNFESTKIGRRRYVDRNQFLKYAEENKKGFLISDLSNKHRPKETQKSSAENIQQKEVEESEPEVSSTENKITDKEISDNDSVSSEADSGLKLANEDLNTSRDRPSSRWRLTRDKLRAVGSSNSKETPSKLPAVAMALILMTALGIAGLNILGSSDTANQSTSSAVVEEAPSAIEQLAGTAGAEKGSSAEPPRENILLASANKAMESVSLAAAATTNFGESVLRPLRDAVVNTLYIGTASLLRIGDTFIADMPTYTPPKVELADSDKESEAATTPAPTAGTYSNRNDVLLVSGLTQLTGIVARLAGSLEEDDSDSSLRAYVRDRVATLERQMYGNDDAVLDAADYDHPRDITLDSVDVGETTSNTLSVSGRTTFSATTSVDTDTLFVDVTNDRVGINTNSPQYALDVVGTFRADTFVANSTSTATDFSASSTDTDTLTADTATITDLTVGDLTATSSADLATTTVTDLSASSTDTDSLTATDATFTDATSTNFYTQNLSADDFDITDITAENATFTNATTTNFFATLANFTDIIVDTITATLGDFVNLEAENATTTQLTAGDLSATSSADLATTTITDLSASSTDTDSLTAGNATTTNLWVTGDTVFGDTELDTLTINASVQSDLIPNSNATLDLGSPSFYWGTAYLDTINANNISAASTSISGTAADDFTLNTDNSTQDGENSSLILYRGQVTPNAVIEWDSVADRFDFNQSIFIDNDSNSTTNPTFVAQATPGQTADLLQLASSSGDVMFSVGSDGSVTAPSASTTDITATNATFTNATTTNFFASLANFTTAIITNLTATVADITDLTAENATTTQLTTGDLSATSSADLATTTITSLSASSTDTDTLTVGNATTTNLWVTGDTVFGDTQLDTLTVNATVESDLIPNSNATLDLGSPSFYWGTAYLDTINVNNISAASTSISGTEAEDFTINTDNNTQDAEDSSLVLYRGQVTPNAVIGWDSAADRFDFNQSIYIENDSNSTTNPTVIVEATSGQTADLLQLASSSGDVMFSVGSDGSVTAPSASTTDITATNATITNATTTNFFATLANFTDIIVDTITATLGDFVNLEAENATTTNLVATDATTTNLTASGNTDLATTTADSLTLQNLTNERLLSLNASGGVSSSDLIDWLSGTTDQVSVVDNGDGTVTLTLPQDIATSSAPTFDGMTLSGLLSFTGTDHAGVRLNALTDGERNALTAQDGMIIFNETESKVQAYTGSGWENVGSMAIGEEVESATSGSVLFVDASGNLAEDNANFYWDDTNDRLGIGTTTPAVTLDINATDAVRLPAGTSAQRPSGENGYIRYNSDNSQFEGYYAGAWQGLGGVIDVDQDTYITAEESSDEDYLRFYTDGSERVTVTNTGEVGIGTNNPGSALEVSGDALFQSTSDNSEAFKFEVSETNNQIPVVFENTAGGMDMGIIGQSGEYTMFNLRHGNTSGDGFNVGIDDSDPGDLVFVARNGSNNEVARLTNTGDFGIGTNNPANTLDVAGGIDADTLNTGQGDNELYAMDQDVQTTDDVTFGSLSTASGTITNLTGENATITNATTTNFFASVANFTTAVFDTITATLGDFTNLEADNATTTNLVATDATTTNLTASGTITTGLTTGSVPFIGASNEISEDNTNFFWDDTNDRLGIGTSTPSTQLEIVGGGNPLRIYRSGSANVAYEVSNSDNSWYMGATGGGYFSIAQDSNIFGNTDLTIDSSGNVGIGLTNAGVDLSALGSGGLYVADNVGIGTTSPDNRLSVNGDANFTGSVGIGTTTPGSALDVDTGGIRVFGDIQTDPDISTTLLGVNAGSSLTSDADYNTLVGLDAGESITTGDANSIFGVWAGDAVVGGSDNSFFGVYSGSNTDGGDRNSFFGHRSGQGNTTGDYNSFFGFRSGQDVTNGRWNTFYGTDAGHGITTGDYNTIIGASVTGLPSDLSNNIIIADGQGNQRVRIDSSGQVGIGTTSPANTLDVEGGIDANTLNTGQGDNELYAMDQDVQTSDTPTFAGVSIGGDTINDFTGTGLSVSANILAVDQSALDVESFSTSLTAGSVVFSDGSSLAQDNANFFWDDTNDRLGIGTSTPSAILEIVGDGSTPYLRIGSGGGGTYAFEVDQNDKVSVGTGNDDIYFNTSGGTNVGVGTSSPTNDFTVVGDSYFEGNVDVTGTTSMSTLTLGSDSITDITGAGLSAVSQPGGGLELAVDNLETISTGLSAGSIIFSDGSFLTEDNSNFFWDDANNRLGIGTTSPATALEVVGTTTVDRLGIGTLSPAELLDVAGTGRAEYIKLITQSQNQTANVLRVGDREAAYGFDFRYTGADTGNDNSLELWTDGESSGQNTNRVFRVFQSGNIGFDQNVGIGTTSPDSLAHLYDITGDAQMRIESGDGDFSRLRFTEFNSGGVEYGSFIRNNGASNLLEIGTVDSDTDYPLIYVPRGTERVGIGTTSPATTLDVAGDITTSGILDVNGTGTSTLEGDVDIAGSILPRSDATYDLGSPSLQWRDVYISSGTLYVGGQRVLSESTDQEITLSADPGQNINIQASTTGNIRLDPSGSGYTNVVNGNFGIGIGTTSPATLLEVGGNTLLSGADRYLNFNSGVGSGGYGIRDNSGNLEFKDSGGSWSDFGSGGGGASAASSSGAVQLSDGAGGLIADGDNFFWDDTNARLGIGTSSPDSLVHLYNDSGDTQMRIESGNGDFSRLRLTEPSLSAEYGSFIRNNGASDLLEIGTIDADTEYPLIYVPRGTEQVGIGTTSPATTLDVAGTITSQALSVGGDTITDFTGSNLSVIGGTLHASDSDTTYTAGTGLNLSNEQFSIDSTVLQEADIDTEAEFETLLFDVLTPGEATTTFTGLTDTPGSYTTSAIPFANGAGDALSFISDFVFDGANFGIGTSSPSASLTVVADGSTPRLRIESATSGTYALEVDENDQAIVGTGSGNIFLDTSGSTNVGIGTQAPSSTLHVAGDITGTGLLDVSGVSSLLGNVGVGTSSPNAELDVEGRIRQANAINCGLEADTNGDLICAGTSDINLKTDITALSATSSLSKINQLQGVRFRYLPQANLGSEEELGFLAQEVEKIFPELVGESNGYKFVDYDKLTAVLAEAVQELDSKVANLESDQSSSSATDDGDTDSSSSSEDEDTDSGGLLASVGAWLSERGVEISDGIARFVEGIFDSLTTSRFAIDNTREEGDDNEDLDPAAGFGEIPTDEDEVEIENNQVATSSQILVTFTEEIDTSYWVEKAVGSFKVRTAEAMSATTSFDYLVVGVEMSEDQLASSTEATTGSDDSQDENDGMTPIDNGSDSDDSTDGAGSGGSASDSDESEETSTSTDSEDTDGTSDGDTTATSTATTTDDATETEDSSTSTSTSTESDDPDTEADSGESDPENNDGAGNGTSTTTETDTEADSGSEESTSDTSTEDGSDGSTTDGSGESTEDSGNEEDSGSSDDVDTTDPSEDEAGETSDSGSSDDGSETSS